LRVSFRTFFVFRSKRGDRLKLLYWDEDGYALWYKRLEEGSFVLPVADGRRTQVGAHGLVLRAAELAMLLDGIELANARRQPRYQRPAATVGAAAAQS
jgi:transposase